MVTSARGKGSGEQAGLQRLLAAVVRDDRVGVRKLLKGDGGLVGMGVEGARLYEGEILHWMYEGDTALHLAAAGHRVAVVRMLVGAGADVNARGNHRRSGPLHYAADGWQGSGFRAGEQVKTIRCLVEAGADLQAADKNGATALHRAVRTRSAAAVEYLLEAGSDATARNASGATPFHLAVQNTGRGGTGEAVAREQQRRIIELMLERGVSVKLKDGRGKSVVDWARSAWVREVLLGGAG